MIRFLLDENVPHAIAHGLANRAVEVATIRDLGLTSVDDGAIAEFADQNDYVIFTHDADFLRLHAESSKHGGFV